MKKKFGLDYPICLLLVSLKYQSLTNIKAPADNELEILLLNVRSFTKTIDIIRNLSYDVMCYSETNCSLEKIA